MLNRVAVTSSTHSSAKADNIFRQQELKTATVTFEPVSSRTSRRVEVGGLPLQRYERRLGAELRTTKHGETPQLVVGTEMPLHIADCSPGVMSQLIRVDDNLQWGVQGQRT